MSVQEHLVTFLREGAARNTNNFSVIVEQLNAEEMMLMRQIVNQQ